MSDARSTHQTECRLTRARSKAEAAVTSDSALPSASLRCILIQPTQNCAILSACPSHAVNHTLSRWGVVPAHSRQARPWIHHTVRFFLRESTSQGSESSCATDGRSLTSRVRHLCTKRRAPCEMGVLVTGLTAGKLTSVRQILWRIFQI